MKTLNVVLRKREELKERLEVYDMKRRDLQGGRSFFELEKEERQEYGYLASVCMKLKVQIDALTYVINYDTELMNASYRVGE